SGRGDVLRGGRGGAGGRPMSKARKTGKVYVVERAAYRAWDYRGMHYTQCSCDQGESYTPVRAFTDEAAAEACRDALEAEARAALSPALFGSYSVPEGLAQRIESLGLPASELGPKEYERAEEFRKWWAEHAAEITPER